MLNKKSREIKEEGDDYAKNEKIIFFVKRLGRIYSGSFTRVF